MALLILLRHGQSQWNLENRFTGWVDVPLTAAGEAEARKAGLLLKKRVPKIDQAFTSDLKRAQHTLEIVSATAGYTVPVEKNCALNERHYGDLQGKNKDELRKQYGEAQVHLWRRSYDIPPPGGESLKTCSERTLPYFRNTILPALSDDKKILVVAHGNSLRSIIMELEQLSAKEILELNLDTGVPLLYEGSVVNGNFKFQKKTILRD